MLIRLGVGPREGIASIRANNESANDGDRLTANGERVSSMQIRSNSTFQMAAKLPWQLAIGNCLANDGFDGSVTLLPAVKKILRVRVNNYVRTKRTGSTGDSDSVRDSVEYLYYKSTVAADWRVRML